MTGQELRVSVVSDCLRLCCHIQMELPRYGASRVARNRLRSFRQVSDCVVAPVLNCRSAWARQASLRSARRGLDPTSTPKDGDCRSDAEYVPLRVASDFVPVVLAAYRFTRELRNSWMLSTPSCLQQAGSRGFVQNPRKRHSIASRTSWTDSAFRVSGFRAMYFSSAYLRWRGFLAGNTDLTDA